MLAHPQEQAWWLHKGFNYPLLSEARVLLAELSELCHISQQHLSTRLTLWSTMAVLDQVSKGRASESKKEATRANNLRRLASARGG